MNELGISWCRDEKSFISNSCKHGSFFNVKCDYSHRIFRDSGFKSYSIQYSTSTISDSTSVPISSLKNIQSWLNPFLEKTARLLCHHDQQTSLF